MTTRKYRRRSDRGVGSQRKASRGPAARTSWDPLAEWYDGWMGQAGSKHHQLVLPTVLELMDLQPNDRVLDLGCGQGVLAEAVTQQKAQYVGVDASPKLIEIARRRHGRQGEFVVGDATKLSKFGEQLNIVTNSFDVAVFLLSIQDIDPLDKAIANATWALKPGGKLIILMTHPAFRIPRQSGWGFDEQRKLQYRRIDQYLSPNKIPLKEYPGQQAGVSFTFHRPLELYFSAMNQAGLMVDQLRELSTQDWITNQTPRAQGRAAREIPLFLAVRARKNA